MYKNINCPHCGKPYSCYRNPTPTVDVIIYDENKGILLVERKNIPQGYALPGGFVDEGEQAETAAIREMKEETNLDIKLIGLLGVYSSPNRDPRQHTMSVVFIGHPNDITKLHAGDDACTANFYQLDSLPMPIVFDHVQIINDFKKVLAKQRQIAPIEPLHI